MIESSSIDFAEGDQLSYLNLRIIQSEHGVSYDQTEHIICKMVNKYSLHWK
jgi:hypothetical protein